MLSRFASAAAVLAVTLAPAAATAQAEGVWTSGVQVYELAQVSINAAAIAPAEFAEKTQAIRSCGDARQFAKTIGARVTRDNFVRATSLPSELRPVLADTPTGHATPVMFEQGGALHVFVVCGRS